MLARIFQPATLYFIVHIGIYKSTLSVGCVCVRVDTHFFSSLLSPYFFPLPMFFFHLFSSSLFSALWSLVLFDSSFGFFLLHSVPLFLALRLLFELNESHVILIHGSNWRIKHSDASFPLFLSHSSSFSLPLSSKFSLLYFIQHSIACS